MCWCGRPPKLSCRVGNDVDVVLLLVESTSSPPSSSTATTNTAWPLLQYNSGSEGGKGGEGGCTGPEGKGREGERERESQTRIERVSSRAPILHTTLCVSLIPDIRS